MRRCLVTSSVGGAAGSGRGPGRRPGDDADRTTPLRPGPVCFLRVYEPLAAFEGAELAHWQAYVASGAAPTTPVGAARERAAGLRALIGRSGRWTGLPEIADEAFVRVEDGVTLLCPWRTEARAWEALTEVRRGLPEQLVDAFTSAEGAVLAERGLQGLHRERERLRQDPAVRRTAIASHSWAVPLRRFVLMEAHERVVQLGGSAAGAPGAPAMGRSLVYRTAMSRARRRTARALAALRRTSDGAVLVPGLADLGRWLEEFHPRSLVELDYGGLVHLMDDPTLLADQSAGELAAALAALSGDQFVEASKAYALVRSRMKSLQAVEAAS